MPALSSNTTLLAFGKLPDLMKSVIDREENSEINSAIESKNKLTAAQGDAMMGVIRSIILQTIRPDELVSVIQRDIHLDEPQAKKLALDLLGERFLPMEFYLGPIRPLIEQLGGNVNEYLVQARQRYPEVYAPKTETPKPSEGETGSEPQLLQNFNEKVETPRGRADILLRLTGLAGQVDELMKAEKLPQADGEALLRDLDTLSYAVNTKDLNPLEVQSLKRRLRKVLGRISEITA
jgi:hypothetical protein